MFSDRKSQESSRRSLESNRKSTESSRKSLESSRKSLESNRKSTESSRKSLDSGRRSLEIPIEQRIATEKLPGDINSLTIALLGHPSAGKSALVASALGQPFSKTHTASPAHTLAQKKLPQREGFTINLIDVGGTAFLPQNFLSLKTQEDKRWRDADIFAVIYACDDKESFETAKHIKKNVLVDDLARTRTVLICTKIERSEKSKVISVEDGKRLAEDWACQIYFTSAKSNENTSAFDTVTLLFLEDLLCASQFDGGSRPAKKSFSSRIVSGFSRKKEKPASSPNGDYDATLSSPRDTKPNSFKKSVLTLSGKNNKAELKTSEIPFARIEHAAERAGQEESSEYFPPDSHNQTTESDEFFSEHSEESKRKIRAARRRFEKLGSADGGWEQAKITIPTGANIP